MKVVIVGGKLQGVEAAYLALEAGWDVIIIDKNPEAPARGLSKEFYQLDIVKDVKKIAGIIKSADFVLPALENIAVLECLERLAMQEGVPLAYDASSYAISSSKKKSDALFVREGILVPVHWPECNLPVIAKPSGLSGSHGVKKINNQRDLIKFIAQLGREVDDWVIQEYLEGPSFSIEVMGFKGSCIPLLTTDLEMDQRFDCKRVFAPTVLPKLLERQLESLSTEIGRLIGLTGIMDVEVINHNGTLKVLEIDARLPSQTPTVVYKSCGLNMISQLYNVFARGELIPPVVSKQTPLKAVIYEHIRVDLESIVTLGEHIMAKAGPLTLFEGFFGADQALSNYKQGLSTWVATLIITDKTRNLVWSKRCEVIENIKRYFQIPNV